MRRLASIASVLAAACTFSAPVSSTGDATGDTPPPGDAADPEAGADAPRPATCPSTYTIGTGTSWYRVGTAASWYDAQLACETDGAHLVVIETAVENAFVLGLHPAGDIFLGMSDHKVEGTFRWVTDVPVTGYVNWHTTQPNNGNGIEDCGEMTVAGQWNDVSCVRTQAYVCECDGVLPPATRTWCETGSNVSCGECDDRCDQRFGGDGECTTGQTCIDGD